MCAALGLSLLKTKNAPRLPRLREKGYRSGMNKRQVKLKALEEENTNCAVSIMQGLEGWTVVLDELD